jgi:hypothetical protein
MRAVVGWLLVATVAVLAAVGTAAQADAPTRAYKIKAAFILDFVRHVQWPREIGPVARLCTVGADPFGDAWAAIADQNVQGRPLQIERNVPPDRLGECMILAIGNLSKDEAATLDRAVNGSPVLTVADDATPAHVDAILRLKSVDNRLHFDLDVPEANRRGLQIAEPLRNLADSVTGSPGGASTQ